MEIRPQTSRDCRPIFYSRFQTFFHFQILRSLSFLPFSSLPCRIGETKRENYKEIYIYKYDIFSRLPLTTTHVRTLACDTALTLTSSCECTRASTILKSSFDRRNDDTTRFFPIPLSPQRMNSKESTVVRSKQPPCDSYPSMGHPL